MGCGLPGSIVHGINPAILEWVAISSSRGSFQPRIKPPSLVSPALAGGFFTTEPPGKPRHHQGLSKILHWPWSFLQAILISFLPEPLPTHLSYMFWLAGRLDLHAYLSALCADGQLLGCKFFETETQAYPSFIPLLSNYQRKGGPECVNGCLFKTKVKEDSPLALFASKGKTGEILDKEHIRDFLNRKHLT